MRANLSWSWLALGLLSAAAAQAEDVWVPYTDGRFGGCYRSPSGQHYGCTVQSTSAAAALEAEAAARTRDELEQLRRELEELKQRQADDDARRAAVEAQLAEAERAAQAKLRADEAAAMAGYNAIEAARDSQRMRELERKTEACRQSLQARGFRIMGPGACRDRDGAYVNCPDC